MLDRVFTSLAAFVYFPLLPLRAACSLLLTGLHIEGSCAPDDLVKYRTFKKEVAHGVVIFNHPNFFDAIVLMKELGYLRFVMSAKYVVWPIRWFVNYMNVLVARPSAGTAATIREAITTRKKGAGLIAISPSAGQNIGIYPAEYKTGAFLSAPTVLPVIVLYEPNEYWVPGTSLMDMVWRRLCGPPLKYRMYVLDPVEPKEGEMPQDFANRCREIVIDNMRNRVHVPGRPPRLCPKCNPGHINQLTSTQCFMTSHLFLLAGLYQILQRSNILYGAGMLTVFVTSVLYHGSGSVLWGQIDITLNGSMAALFASMLAVEGQHFPLTCLMAAMFGYASNIHHAILVHLPIAAGFFAIR
jgi:hypothetical protein